MRCQTNRKHLGCHLKENAGKISGSQTLTELLAIEVVEQSPSGLRTTPSEETSQIESQKLFEKQGLLFV